MSYAIAFTGILTYYKTFAMTFLKSDRFVTIYIGSVTGVCQFISRIFYGIAMVSGSITHTLQLYYVTETDMGNVWPY